MLPVDISVLGLDLKYEVHELHVSLVLLQVSSISHPDLIRIASNQVLIAVEYRLPFKTHFLAVM